jgi:hypothetical protein
VTVVPITILIRSDGSCSRSTSAARRIGGERGGHAESLASPGVKIIAVSGGWGRPADSEGTLDVLVQAVALGAILRSASPLIATCCVDSLEQLQWLRAKLKQLQDD